MQDVVTVTVAPGASVALELELVTEVVLDVKLVVLLLVWFVRLHVVEVEIGWP